MGEADTMRTVFKILTFAFLVTFLIVVAGAVATALPLTRSWYNAESSYWTYGATLVASSVFLLMLLVGTAARRQHLDREIRVVEDWVSDRVAETVGWEIVDWDSLPNRVEATFETRYRSHSARNPAADAKVESRRILAALRRREALTEGRRDVTKLILPPVLFALVILAASAAMLPGAGGFAQAQGALNTALVLIVAYGSAILAFYIVTVQLALLATGRPSGG